MGAAVAVGTTTGATAAVTSGSAAAVGAVSTTAAASRCRLWWHSGSYHGSSRWQHSGSRLIDAHAAVSGGTAAATTAATGGSTAAVGSAVSSCCLWWHGGSYHGSSRWEHSGSRLIGRSRWGRSGNGLIGRSWGVALSRGVTAGALLVPLAGSRACAVSSAVILSLPSKETSEPLRSAEQEGPTYDSQLVSNAGTPYQTLSERSFPARL